MLSLQHAHAAHTHFLYSQQLAAAQISASAYSPYALPPLHFASELDELSNSVTSQYEDSYCVPTPDQPLKRELRDQLLELIATERERAVPETPERKNGLYSEKKHLNGYAHKKSGNDNKKFGNDDQQSMDSGSTLASPAMYPEDVIVDLVETVFQKLVTEDHTSPPGIGSPTTLRSALGVDLTPNALRRVVGEALGARTQLSSSCQGGATITPDENAETAGRNSESR